MTRLLLLIFVLNSATHGFEKEINSQCSSSFTGDDGICMEGKDCPTFKIHRNVLNICSFNGRIPIVCCPKQFINRDDRGRQISARKCEEYFSEKPHSASLVAGTSAKDNEFPHMSSIGWRLWGEISWRCGGSLISERFVLSAAHCTNSVDGKPNVIRVGDRDLQDVYDAARPQEFEIKKSFVHPKYRRNLKYHDIALFELNRRARFDKSVQPACLHQTDDDLSQYTPTAMGWGQTSFGGKPSNTLMKGLLNFVSNSECNKHYNDEMEELPNGIINSQICAWDPNGKRDTCLGDSGGPLQISKIHNVSGRTFYEIIGITSFGKFCAAGTPGVYVKVSSYLDWIESIVWPNNE